MHSPPGTYGCVRACGRMASMRLASPRSPRSCVRAWTAWRAQAAASEAAAITSEERSEAAAIEVATMFVHPDNGILLQVRFPAPPLPSLPSLPAWACVHACMHVRTVALCS